MKITQLMVVIAVGILLQCTDAASRPMMKVILDKAPSKVKSLAMVTTSQAQLAYYAQNFTYILLSNAQKSRLYAQYYVFSIMIVLGKMLLNYSVSPALSE